MKKKLPVTGRQDPVVLVPKDEQREALDRDVEVFLLAGGEVEVLPTSGSQDIISRIIERLKGDRWQ